MGKLLTFSIAAYNVEDTLSQLMDSLLAINMPEYVEILIVNDGSKDHTLEMARAYEEQYPDCVKVIDKENGGHGSTINTGIQYATGKYFRPIDGDDWIVSRNARGLIKRIPSIDSDVIVMDFLKCYEDKGEKGSFKTERKRVEGLVDGCTYPFEKIAAGMKVMGYHMMIYRTELLRKNKIWLDEHCFYVDTELNCLPVPYIETVTYFEHPLYCYRYGTEGQSVTRENRKKHVKDSQIVAERLLAFLKEQEGKLSENKRKYLVRGVRGICTWHFRTLTYFAPTKEKKEELIAFDKAIRAYSKDVYDAMVRDRKSMDNKKNADIIFLLRASNFWGYMPVCRYTELKRYVSNFLRK